jgi:NADPH-dependent ferric siderophore reductase
MTVLGWRRAVGFDPGYRYLRASAAAMITVVLTFWSMLELSRFAPVDIDAIVLSVVVAVMLTRRDIGTPVRERATDLATLALSTGAAALVGMASHSVVLLGETLFVLALGCFVWLRRFGPRAARLGTIATLPFVATLVTPLPIPISGDFALWALVGVIVAFTWATLVQFTRSSAGPARLRDRRLIARTPGTAIQASRAAPREAARRLVPSTRMAIQLAFALAAAFAVGHLLFPEHIVWPVITAFIVCAGNRGRGDVVYKGILRIAGGVAGTVFATLLSFATLPGGAGAIVGIFLLLTLALWLRPVSYAYWAACVTAVLALLYGYFGQTGPGVFESRLLGVLWGGAIAIAVCWFVLPVKTRDVLRRRSADVLRALSAFARAAEAGDAELTEERRHAAARAIERVGELAPTLRAARRVHTQLVRRRRPTGLLSAFLRPRGAPAADLLDIVCDAVPQVEHLAAAVAVAAPLDADLAALRERMRVIRAALEEIRHTAGWPEEQQPPSIGAAVPFPRESVRHPMSIRHLTVDRVTRLTPTLVRATLRGDELTGFASDGPADHVKVFFADAATGILTLPEFTPEGVRHPESGTIVSRDYTPRAFRAGNNDYPAELDIDFVVHGTDGPASAWALSARAGDQLVVAGPRGSRLVPAGIARAVLLADETALPALARWLEQLPPEVGITALVDAENSAVAAYLPDELRLRADIVWLFRENGPGQLLAALRSLGPIADDTFVFGAGEASMLVPVRTYLRRELGLPAEQVALSGYWRRGVANLDHHAPIDPSDPD